MHPKFMATTFSETSFTTRQLGNSDLQLTPIGYGAWAIGGGNWEFAWGAQDDEESIYTIERALDAASTGSTRRLSTVSAILKRSWVKR